MKLSPIERLAREICWAGFVTPKVRLGTTKARYWESLPENTRKNYECEARQFVHLLDKLPLDELNRAHDIANRARRAAPESSHD